MCSRTEDWIMLIVEKVWVRPTGLKFPPDFLLPSKGSLILKVMMWWWTCSSGLQDFLWSWPKEYSVFRVTWSVRGSEELRPGVTGSSLSHAYVECLYLSQVLSIVGCYFSWTSLVSEMSSWNVAPQENVWVFFLRCGKLPDTLTHLERKTHPVDLLSLSFVVHWAGE